MSNDFEDAISYAFQAMTMSKFTVFYGQQLYGEFEKFPKDLPDGAYVKTISAWYVILAGALTPINYSDIPNEVRLNCLLMGISV